jgi:tetratricopeptide (TPR) repeat protein
MNSFKPTIPEIDNLVQLKDKAIALFKENQLSDSAEVCVEILKSIGTLSEDMKEKYKDVVDSLSSQVRDQLTLNKFKLEDYDSAIEECLAALNEKQSSLINNRVGICYFKKGKYYKARDHFLKAKEVDPNDNDKIAENYLKQTLEMIADIES